MADYITDIEADGNLNTALQNFHTVCAANATALGLGLPDLTAILNATTNFTNDLNAVVAAKAASKAAASAKDAQKKASKAVVSQWAKTFRANVTVSDALLAQLMLPPHKTPGTKSAPTTPTALVASADGLGNVYMSWNRGANRNGTVFLIEFRTSPTADWAVLNSTTKVKFSVQATPGSYIAFRVSAQRNSQTSAASTPVALWDGSRPVTLAIAA